MYFLIRSVLALIAGISIIFLSFFLSTTIPSRINILLPPWRIRFPIIQVVGGGVGAISGGFVASIMLWIPWTRQIAPSTFFIGLPLGSSIGVMMASTIAKGTMSKSKGILSFVGSLAAIIIAGAASPGSYLDVWAIALFMLVSLIGGVLGYDIPDLLGLMSRRKSE